MQYSYTRFILQICGCSGPTGYTRPYHKTSSPGPGAPKQAYCRAAGCFANYGGQASAFEGNAGAGCYQVGFGGIVASEKEVPNMLADMV